MNMQGISDLVFGRGVKFLNLDFNKKSRGRHLRFRAGYCAAKLENLSPSCFFDMDKIIHVMCRKDAQNQWPGAEDE